MTPLEALQRLADGSQRQVTPSYRRAMETILLVVRCADTHLRWVSAAEERHGKPERSQALQLLFDAVERARTEAR